MEMHHFPVRESITLFAGLEGVLQADGAVEDQVAGGAVAAVGAEVAQTHELVGSRSLGVTQGGLDLAAGQDFQGVGVHVAQQGLHAGGVRGDGIEQVLVQPDLGIHGGLGVHPVDGGTLDLAAVGRIAAAGLGIIGGQDLGDVAVLIGVVAGAGDQVSALQAALQAVGIQALVLGNGSGQEVVGLDPKVTGEGGGATSADASGQYTTPLFGGPIKKKTMYITQEQEEYIKNVIAEESVMDTSIGNFGFDAPIGDGKKNKNNKFFADANDHKDIMKKSWPNEK